ncbi:MAG: hypothetical protein HC799_11460 [Limnothrix sp. RL_2_0]|nr:hypothetical protein [Limnothrix sp. RL_2_0]
MAGCIYCVDNDILKKLATFQLFDSTLKIFHITYQNVKILGTAKYKFRNSRKKIKSGRSRQASDEVINWDRLIRLTETLPCIENTEIDLNLFAQLSEYKDIDAGEAELVCQAISLIQKDKLAQIFTGDKRFIKALAKVDLQPVHDALKNRILCLEQIVLKNIENLGFEEIRHLVAPVRECDKSIKSVFGSGIHTDKDNAVSTLNGYISDLRKDSNSLLR